MSLLTTPKMHSGVGAPQYTTVTSPIRRLLDLIMQLQIKNLIKGQGVLFSKKDMKYFGSIILETLDKANQVRYLRQRYWRLKYLETKIGERLPATIMDHTAKRVHVFLEDFLLDSGFKVLTAENGQEAVEIVEREKVDVIMSDLVMPRMDGIALTRAIMELG